MAGAAVGYPVGRGERWPGCKSVTVETEGLVRGCTGAFPVHVEQTGAADACTVLYPELCLRVAHAHLAAAPVVREHPGSLLLPGQPGTAIAVRMCR